MAKEPRTPIVFFYFLYVILFLRKIIAIITNISPIIDTINGIEFMRNNILNPVAMISMKPNTARGRERRDRNCLFI